MRRNFCVFCNLVFLFALTTAPVFGAGTKPQTWEGLKHMMNAEEFRAAGLDKLSADELGHLDQWLLHFLAYDSQQVLKTDTVVKELQKAGVRRRIAGHFSGWSGQTVFTLDNGEVWKQRLPGRYAVSIDNPEVEIARNLLGFYELRVVKTGRKIGVTRLK